ncbi:hypothetical protein [Aerosakkonema funiforme]
MLSHMHEDHFDRVAAEKLHKNLPIITTHHAAVKLKQKGFTAPHGSITGKVLLLSKVMLNL